MSYVISSEAAVDLIDCQMKGFLDPFISVGDLCILTRCIFVKPGIRDYRQKTIIKRRLKCWGFSPEELRGYVTINHISLDDCLGPRWQKDIQLWRDAQPHELDACELIRGSMIRDMRNMPKGDSVFGSPIVADCYMDNIKSHSAPKVTSDQVAAQMHSFAADDPTFILSRRRGFATGTLECRYETARALVVWRLRRYVVTTGKVVFCS